MKEKIDELLKDFNGRLRNPLIMSFIFVWLYWHWDLVYWVFTVEENKSVYLRTSTIIAYIRKQTFFGMVLCPLLVSFFSLAIYYLIANAAQFIQVWVGRRLNIAMLIKSDTGRYVERAILEKETKKNRELKIQINNLSEEIDRAKQTRDDSEKLLDDLEIEKHEALEQLKLAKLNIDYNHSFKKEILKPLIYLLGKKYEISVLGLSEPKLLKKDYSILQGNWELCDYDSIDNDSWSVISINIEDKEVTYPDEKEYGTLTHIEIDITTSIVSFKIFRKNGFGQGMEDFHVIKINRDEFIGLRGNSYINLKRRKIR